MTCSYKIQVNSLRLYAMPFETLYVHNHRTAHHRTWGCILCLTWSSWLKNKQRCFSHVVFMKENLSACRSRRWKAKALEAFHCTTTCEMKARCSLYYTVSYIFVRWNFWWCACFCTISRYVTPALQHEPITFYIARGIFCQVHDSLHPHNCAIIWFYSPV